MHLQTAYEKKYKTQKGERSTVLSQERKTAMFNEDVTSWGIGGSI